MLLALSLFPLLLQVVSSLSSSPDAHSLSERAPPTVKSHGATYIGLVNSTFNVESWRSIRYAQPPNGTLRLQPPAPAHNKGIISSTQYGHACFQMIEADDPFNALSQSEDCLTLSIFRPVGVSKSSRVPVMFWIHGGAFLNGAGITFDCDSIANRSSQLNEPVIVISINYRLNFFGFSSGTTLHANDGLNLGLLDQRQALKWTKENIAAFGGDPNKITLVGESAGATSIGLQMTAYNGRNDHLFRSGILQSGSPMTQTPCPAPNDTYYASAYDAVVTALNCTGPSNLTCIQSIPEQQLFPTVLAVGRNISGGSNLFPYGPVVDGKFIAEHPAVLVAKRKVIKLPMIIGFTTDEFTYWVPTIYNISSDAVLIGLSQTIFPNFPPAVAQKLVDLDPLSEYPDVGVGGIHWKRATALVSDVFERCPGRAFALNQTAHGVWKYRWNAIIPSEYAAQPWCGVVHGCDLTYNFGTPRTTALNETADLALSATVQQAWIAFTACTNPNCLGDLSPGVKWPKYKADSAQVMVFETTNRDVGGVGQGLHTERDTDDRPMCDYVTANDALFGK